MFTRENIERGVNQSLQRMKTDHLDLVQVHISPSRKELEENGTIETLKGLQREGKVRFLGMSGTIPNLADHIAMGAGTRGLDDRRRTGGGRHHHPGRCGPRGEAASQQGDRWQRWEQAGLDGLLEPEETRTEFLLRFTLSHPSMHTTIVGTMNPEHLQQNLRAYRRGPLSPEVYGEAKRRLG